MHTIILKDRQSVTQNIVTDKKIHFYNEEKTAKQNFLINELREIKNISKKLAYIEIILKQNRKFGELFGFKTVTSQSI